MNLVGFQFQPDKLPPAADTSRAVLGLDRLRESAAGVVDPDVAAWVEGIAADAAGGQLLQAVFGNSAFLVQCAVSDPGSLRLTLQESPDAAVAAAMASLPAAADDSLDTRALSRCLRVAKRRIALAVAVADIAGLWPLEKVTGVLSDFAGAALDAACRHLLRERARAGAFALADPADPLRGSGLIVLGMGKLGAHELNYSSDIDLIVLYDAEVVRTDDPDALQSHVVRLTRDLVRLIDERTADGYVFRTDLRLRPDPGSTPPAMSVLAAEIYYESLGQNWERAAMIKARPVAGDKAAGQAFVDMLRPFVWRRNLDFAAIQDVHSIKRQINAFRGGGQIAVKGHNIKLGRGGIREIEFFAQTQQLIWGGREPSVRAAGTEAALRALCDLGPVAERARDELIAAYRFLRQLEHRLQMRADEQTQTLPQDDEGLAAIAAFMGYARAEDFVEVLLGHLRRVEAHYAALFEDAPALGAAGAVGGNLVFTGGEADPDTLATIRRFGFQNPQAVDSAVRGWHHGRVRAMRSTRARELLTELTPRLLTALARTADPDAAFLRFGEFLSRLPAGVQLFSMFHSRPEQLDLVAEIMGEAPRLAEHLARRPQLLDSVLTADFFKALPGRDELGRELDALLARADHIEAVLDTCRRWAGDRRFQVGVQRLREMLPAHAIAQSLSAIADVALDHLLPRVAADFAAAHGQLPGSEMVVVAMGKLGSEELTPTSDLDLIFVYTYPEGCEESDGARPLSPTQYFARLGQRLIGALTAQTAEGRLYEVDLRLRPSGHAGPLATRLDAWEQYQAANAWTWEHMALTRARPVAGPQRLRARIAAMIHEVLVRPRDPDALVLDVADMRARMAQERATEVVWDIKDVRGGLVDVEFIAQYLQLRHAHGHPQILATATPEALRRAEEAGVVDPADAERLIAALDLWHAIQGMLRLFMDAPPRAGGEAAFPAKLRQELARAGGAVDFDDLQEKMRSARQAVVDIFDRLIAGPAERVRLMQPAGAPQPTRETTP